MKGKLYKRLSRVVPYKDGVFDESNEHIIESALNSWLEQERPKEWQITNGETIFIKPFHIPGREIGPKVVFVLHIVYQQ